MKTPRSWGGMMHSLPFVLCLWACEAQAHGAYTHQPAELHEERSQPQEDSYEEGQDSFWYALTHWGHPNGRLRRRHYLGLLFLTAVAEQLLIQPLRAYLLGALGANSSWAASYLPSVFNLVASIPCLLLLRKRLQDTASGSAYLAWLAQGLYLAQFMLPFLGCSSLSSSLQEAAEPFKDFALITNPDLLSREVEKLFKTLLRPETLAPLAAYFFVHIALVIIFFVAAWADSYAGENPYGQDPKGRSGSKERTTLREQREQEDRARKERMDKAKEELKAALRKESAAYPSRR